jgi:hypothetical protein
MVHVHTIRMYICINNRKFCLYVCTCIYLYNIILDDNVNKGLRDLKLLYIYKVLSSINFQQNKLNSPILNGMSHLLRCDVKMCFSLAQKVS